MGLGWWDGRSVALEMRRSKDRWVLVGWAEFG